MTVQRLTIWLQTSSPVSNRQLIAHGVQIATEHGAELNAVITVPKLARSSHWAVGGIVSGMAADVEAKAQHSAAELARALEQARASAGLTGATATHAMAPHLFGDFVASRARLSDLVIARATTDEEMRSQCEALIFGVARPVLLLPLEEDASADAAFDKRQIAVAWDGGRTATRAVFDALPLLKRARAVTLIQIIDDKDLTGSSTITELSDLLERHGVASRTAEFPSNGRPTAVAIHDAFEQSGAGLLVMGAYGHSRAREFILGGATRGTLQACAFPALLSH